MKLGIRAKFILLIALLLMPVFAGIALYLNATGTATLRANLLNESKAFATLATEPIGNTFVLYKDSGTALVQSKVDDFAELNTNIVNIAVVDVNGNVLFSQNKDRTPRITPEQASSFERVFVADKNKALQAVVAPYFENFGAHRYSLVYSVSNESITKSIRQATWSIVFMSTLAIAISMALLYVFVNRWLITRIQLINIQSHEISNGNLDQEILIKSHDELGALAASVNSMADSLKASINKLKELDSMKSEFMIITSHNLRTPLSIIDGYIENAEALNSVQELKDVLKNISAGSKRLGTFAEDILTISQIESGQSFSQSTPTLIKPFIEKLSDEFKDMAALNNLHFEANLEPISGTVSMSPPHIRAAIWNILDNAVKFTPKGGIIQLTLTAAGGKAIIRIRDTGIGIAPEEIPKLFTKFHRGTSVLTYNYEGTGIGLYASKLIIERHGGTIGVESQVEHGTTFTVTLPLVETPNQ